MANIERDRLRKIKTFPSLVKYLRDELDWPIESDNFEDIFFDWDPQELGIDAASAAKIEGIKQLRPLTSSQPWGIFFIKFEPKKLPVVVLRRILSQLVIKKRFQKADQAVWREHDLLFISNYGEGDDRQITFAQFSQLSDKDLPTLRVLGWDDADTALHLDHTHHVLKEKLVWREEFKKDSKMWRDTWSEAFVLRNREVIETSKDLAEQLAMLAKRIRKRAKRILKIESDIGPLRQLHTAFQKALIHDLDRDDFADMYAQTIAYGLLAARMSRQDNLVADHISDMVPVTNPFLKELLDTFLNVGGRKAKIDFDELGIQDIVELLNDPNTKIDAILRDFGNKTRQEDPVVHFYESFLKAYDAELKFQRGVFYTPQPVVSYIVRSVHELLQTEFKLEDGLASIVTWGEMTKREHKIKVPEGTSPDSFFVQILDPATGTGTFLVEVIDVVYRHMTVKWTKEGQGDKKRNDLWNDYVARCLLPRLYGYEIMMAPYTVAHMKISLKLVETGYRFGVGERLRVYLTNTLEPATDDYIGGDWFYALAHEAQAVNAIKRHQRFTVVIGNPPYSGLSANMSEHAQRLVDAYKIVDGEALNERKLWLQDDYVKFIRFGQWQVELSNVGILGYITNHAYLDNPTFRGMRQQITNTFSCINIVDLHGNAKKKERAPDGSDDTNVFDIAQGVAIGIFRRQASPVKLNIFHADLWGTRELKYKTLTQKSVNTLAYSCINPNSPFYFFVPRSEINRDEYEVGWKINDIMETNVTGIVTARDEFVIDIERKDLLARIEEFRNLKIKDGKIRKKYFQGKGSPKYPDGDSRGWKMSRARIKVHDDKKWKERVVPILYRPFDVRFIYYTDWMVDWPRPEVMRHMIEKKNIGLIIVRQVAEGVFNHVFVTRHIVESRITVSNKGIGFILPFYLCAEKGTDLFQMLNNNGQSCNLSKSILEFISNKLHLRFIPEGLGDLDTTFGPEDVINYVYSIFHSPSYRIRYAEFLKTDFPRLSLTTSLDLFRALAKLGGELVALHLMESPKLDKYLTKFVGDTKDEIEKVEYSEKTVWIDKDKTTGFKGVPENVWNFHIGGYQVCEKWLKDRKGRKLSKDDIEHYQKIVVALNETIKIMAKIDKVIDVHGGWPKAFLK